MGGTVVSPAELPGSGDTSREAVVLVGGEALFDLVLGEDGSLRAHAGGGPFNVARTLGRLGQPVAYLGRLSTDRFGTSLGRLLAEDGVDLSPVVGTDDPTTLALAELDADGSAVYRFYERGTSVPGLTVDAALAALPPSVSMLHVGTLGLVLEPAASALEAVVEALAGRALVAVDPNVRPGVISDPAAYRARLARIVARSDVVKVSEDDLAWLAPEQGGLEAARAMLGAGPAAVLLTRGSAGAVALTAAGDVDVPAPRVEVVDTIGAGDAFGGGFLAWWRERGLGRDDLDDTALVAEAAGFAALVAARTCARAGASPPRRDELAG
jgi:fructokinase